MVIPKIFRAPYKIWSQGFLNPFPQRGSAPHDDGAHPVLLSLYYYYYYYYY